MNIEKKPVYLSAISDLKWAERDKEYQKLAMRHSILLDIIIKLNIEYKPNDLANYYTRKIIERQNEARNKKLKELLKENVVKEYEGW